MITQEQRQIRELKRHLTELINAIDVGLDALDKAMEQSESPSRGKNIALIANHLSIARDGAKHFGLGMDFKNPKFYYKRGKNDTR